MASNDMQVLMYKILKYLYECMKNGIEPKLEDFSWDSKLMDVPQSYWVEIIAILVEDGYIDGFSVMRNKVKDVKLHIQTNRPYRITYKGVCFLDENSGMKKEKEFLSSTFPVILSSVLGVIIQP